jgi:methyltransferase-like protein
LWLEQLVRAGMEEFPKINSELVFMREVGESMLFDPCTGGIRVLNETAVYILDLLDGKHNRREIIDLLIKDFELTDVDEIATDLDDFLKEMDKNHLLDQVE